MKLEDIRIRVEPTHVVASIHKGRKVPTLKGGEHILMAPGETTQHAWYHFERKEIQPGDQFIMVDPTGQAMVAPGPVSYPEGRTHRVAAFLHKPDGTVIEHHYYDVNGIPAEKHPLEVGEQDGKQ